MWYKEAKKSFHTGVMIAFYIPDKIAKKINKLTKEHVDTVEPPKELHMTLAFLGDMADMPGKKDEVAKVVKEVASKHPAYIKGAISGIGLFSNSESDGTKALYASLDLPDLPAFRQTLVEAINKIKGVSVMSNHGFTPHMTIAYIPKSDPMPPIDIPIIDVEFTEVVLSWGDEQEKFPLTK